MDVDHKPQGQTTPPGTPFDDDFTTTASKRVPNADPPAGVHTENLYTPLYTDSQPTGHSNRTATYTDQAQDTQPAAGASATSTKTDA